MAAAASDDIFSYIADALSPTEKDVLYADPFVAMSVFRALDAMGQQLVMRMLLPDCTTAEVLGGAPSVFPGENPKPSPGTARGPFASSLVLLERLRVAVPGRPEEGLRLNPVLRKALISGLAGDGTVPAPKTNKSQDAVQIDKFAWIVWEGVLNFIVGIKDVDAGMVMDEGMTELLENADLIKRIAGRKPQITAEGFQFLLKDVYAQIWTVLRQYLEDYSAARKTQGFDKLKVLQFLFQLGYCKVGQPYPLSAMEPGLQDIIRTQLSKFGIVFVPENKETKEISRKTYYATPLGVHLASRALSRPLFRDSDSKQQSSGGYILVETNYRVYAYIDHQRNKLQVALLNLFVDVQYCLPNLAVGTITRDSVLNALRAGITANQLLGYLYQRAHPVMRKNNPVIPETVADQVRLWETERNRITAQPGTLYRSFKTQREYTTFKEEATRLGGLLHADDTKQVLVVTRECEEPLSRLRDSG